MVSLLRQPPTLSSQHLGTRIRSRTQSNLLIILIIILLLLISLDSRLGNTVQISLPALRNAPATLVLVLLQHANLLKRLHDFAVYGAGGIDVVGRAGSAVLGAAVDFAEAADTNGFADVDVAGDGCGADVEP
jgi:hypothetical protein